MIGSIEDGGTGKGGYTNLNQVPTKPKRENDLQTGSVDHLVVHNELTAAIVDDQGTHATTTLLEGLTDAAEEVALGHDRDTLLDITGLGHGNDLTLTEVEDAVGLVDRTQHGLNDNRGGGVGDEAGLFLQLTGEEVNAEVAVLAGLGRDGDTDNLAGAALEDQNIANADEVAGDRDGLGVVATATAAARLNDTDILTDAITDTNWTAIVSNDDILTVVMMVIMIMMMIMVMERVHDAVGSAFHTTTEGVVFTVVVVVAHLACWGMVNYSSSAKNLDLRGRRIDWLDVELTTAERGAGVGVDGGSFVSAVVRDVKLGSGRGTVVRDVRGVLALLVGIYTNLAGSLVVDVVGRVDTTTIFTLSKVELVGKLLIVNLLMLLEADRRGRFTIAKGKSS
ncbi:hypothetical protein BDV29DRAFT_7325 [Aspergillus leporis]|uniref:Uncharacterized protein n=1 Tax=Aspergillus leporis TaxID=41062 RepID=A0A5N5WUD8_9EURO|nr:hypothetical protein BDV29DRAFT_7325 [Aspergillus leporis]